MSALPHGDEKEKVQSWQLTSGIWSSSRQIGCNVPLLKINIFKEYQHRIWAVCYHDGMRQKQDHSIIKNHGNKYTAQPHKWLSIPPHQLTWVASTSFPKATRLSFIPLTSYIEIIMTHGHWQHPLQKLPFSLNPPSTHLGLPKSYNKCLLIPLVPMVCSPPCHIEY